MRGFVAFAVMFAACAAPKPSSQAPAGPPVDVTIARAELADLPSPIEAGGVVRARLTAPVAARLMAPIADVKVRAGARVRRGDTLVVLDGREMSANKARAQAGLAASQQAIAAAEAQQRATQAQLTLARATYTRVDALHAKRSATAQELDEVSAALRGAEAQAAAADAGLSQARAGLDAARAGADAATIGASYATLTAPFDGLVTERLADPGTMATPGMPLLTIEDTAAFRLEVRLDEARAASVHVGDEASVRIDTLPGVAAQGRVVEIARLDAMSHSFLVKVELPPAEGIRSGLFGTATFAGPTHRSVAVPATALIPRGQLTFVYAVDGDGTARLRPVSAAAPVGNRVEVLAGVAPGDQVVLAPPPSLSDGARVRTGVHQ